LKDVSAHKKGRQHSTAGSPPANDLEKELAHLKSSSLDQLRKAWQEQLGTEPPGFRARDILLRMLAWQIQAKAVGGFDPNTERQLREIAKAFERDPAHRPKPVRILSPGVVLTREWKGVLQRVTVETDGFSHLGRRYRTLSEVARAITGTKWSGPRFFGLESRQTGEDAQ
jgi:hypothetical protein